MAGWSSCGSVLSWGGLGEACSRGRRGAPWSSLGARERRPLRGRWAGLPRPGRAGRPSTWAGRWAELPRGWGIQWGGGGVGVLLEKRGGRPGGTQELVRGGWQQVWGRGGGALGCQGPLQGDQPGRKWRRGGGGWEAGRPIASPPSAWGGRSGGRADQPPKWEVSQVVPKFPRMGEREPGWGEDQAVARPGEWDWLPSNPEPKEKQSNNPKKMEVALRY